jgi:NAD(P)-dependent dehydrogenase (short-subunit alcohol dehydrogenase family)
MDRLRGKVAIVTGAASGIGAATAEVLAEEGARVVVADLNEDGAHQQAERLVAAGHDVTAARFDLGDEQSIAALVSHTLDAFGSLDVLHNNAAATHLAATRDLPIAAADPAVWDETMRINVRGTMLATKLAAPHLIAGGGGSIINTASGSGLTGDLSNPAYGASKAAIISLTQYAATQYGKQGLRVNAIAPGLIVTPATAESGHSQRLGDIMLRNTLLPRLGAPRDVAYLVLFLASDESGFVTGQILGVDGGMHAHAAYYSDFMALAEAEPAS